MRMRNAGCRMPDAGCRMPDVGCGMRNVGCGMQSLSHRSPERRRRAGCGLWNAEFGVAPVRPELVEGRTEKHRWIRPSLGRLESHPERHMGTGASIEAMRDVQTEREDG